MEWSGRLRRKFATHRQKLAAEGDAHGQDHVEARRTRGHGRSRRRARGRLRRRRRLGVGRRDDGAVVRAQGRARHRRGAAERQRVQRARLQGPPARGEGARDRGSRRRGQDGRRLRPEHVDAGAPGVRPDHRGGLRAGRRDRRGGEEVPRHALRDRRRRPVVPQGEPAERPRAALRGAAGRVPGRLPRRARGEALRRRLDQRGRRLQGAPGRPLHRRLPGRRRGRRAGHEGALGLLAGLGGPGEVQGARPQPDRGRLRRSCSRSRARAGSGALSAAQDEKVWGIGVDADQSFLGDARAHERA